ncbi:MAG: SCO1 protein [Elusimicrobia bacterium]|nr:SCO1 protein [Elusimicrobiota bacterium]
MNSIKNLIRATMITLGGVVLGLLAWRIGRQPTGPGSSLVEVPTYGSVKDFVFVDQTGQPFGLKNLKQKYWLADFFFTRCMGPCPLLTNKMKELQAEFSHKEKLSFVSFSVDPDHDTPEVLSLYAKTYELNLNKWTFVTGSKEKMYELIRESFHLAVEPSNPPSLNDILHSLYFVLVNPQGQVTGYFNTGDPEAMKKLRHALANI